MPGPETAYAPLGTKRLAIVVAATSSAGAALIHAAAAGAHEGDSTLAALFSLCAIAQLGWAVAVLLRPTTPVLAIGVGINAGALGAWTLSRTTGWPLIDS